MTEISFTTNLKRGINLQPNGSAVVATGAAAYRFSNLGLALAWVRRHYNPLVGREYYNVHFTSAVLS